MKVSIRWIFDHIESSWSAVDMPHLVQLFNEKTAEIEKVEHVTIDLKNYSVVRVTHVDEQKVIVSSDEWPTEVELSPRNGVQVDAHYLIKKESSGYRWATLMDFSSDKEGLFPAVCNVPEWKKDFEIDDYILHVDNKSITHRPDLWGHRGFAREVAALLDLPFKDEQHFLADKAIQNHAQEVSATVDNPFTIAIKDPELCKRFAGLYFGSIEYRPSSLWMAHRLARIDARPIDFIVDATNYVMFDISQPLHAFDADKIPTHTIAPQRAHAGQKLELLDDQTVELTDKDLVISDGERPLALAGIMGGKESGISSQTKHLFLESANFDATTIRRTSVRFKVRSQASARFEKSLDPNQNVTGILRFLKLLDSEGLPYTSAHTIVSLGKTYVPITIEIAHSFIEQCIGTKIETDFVLRTLEKIQFKVESHGDMYTITVPTFRATKDIGIKEDIAEEVARFYGYSAIPAQLPKKETKAHALEHVYRLRSIKQLCAYSMVMREVYNYAFFDESFLTQLHWEPTNAVAVKNPISENHRRLVTSLVPGLFKCLVNNNTQEQMRFFEWGRVWHEDGQVSEQSALSAVLFDKKQIDFYDAKATLEQLFSFFDMSVEWQKVEKQTQPWFMPYQTAQLLIDGVVIGIAGKGDKTFLHQVIEGDAFIFELNGDALLSYVRPQHRYKEPSKYPPVERDISMLVPLRLTVRHVIQAIKSVDGRVTAIRLIDMFDKREWADQRSLTFRFNIQATDRTLTKEDADTVWQKVAQAIKELGATIR